ncbi:MAG: low molecular weight phosphatase family protein [Acidimicrobiia bacterium]
MKSRVLFVCTGNAGRSRMAEAFFNELAPEKHAASAGTHPEPRPHPEVVSAMSEVGIHIPPGPGRLLTFEMLDNADRVIAMGCNIEEACPGADADEDWGLPDPAGGPIQRVRDIRDEIRRRVKILIDELYGTKSGTVTSN